MIALDCFFGAFHDDLAASIPEPFEIEGRSLEEIFASGSRRSDGTPDIRLQLHRRNRLTHATMPASLRATPYYLHRALEQLLPDSPTSGPVTQIGVIFAERLALAPHSLGDSSLEVPNRNGPG